MAWVSVHEEITGKKLRSLSKEIGCSQNECIGLLIRLWLWGLKNADRTGKIVDADRNDIAQVIAVGLERSISTTVAVDAMVNCGWIDDENGNLYLHDWEEWQEYWYAKQEKRERDAERKRNARKKERTNNDETAEKPETKAESDKAVSRYSQPFEEFWQVYPRRVGKGEAYAKYKARINDGWTDEQLIEAAKKYSHECVKQHTEMQFIKHAKTFLSDKTPFTDYLPRGLNFGNALLAEGSPASDDDPYGEWRGQ